jgi:hypothetical protein
MTGPRVPFPTPLEVDDLPADAPWRPALEVARVEQRRWTVLLRYLLAVPNLVVLWLAGILAWVCVVPGWWVAVFTGRLPGWYHRLATGYLVANVRLSGYLMLLTDQRPPIGFAAEAAYPIWFPPPPRTRLRRVTVLFRLILVIPAMVVTTVASTGWWVVGVVHWIIVLVKRRYPEPLFRATTSILCLVGSYTAYLLLLTDRYPLGQLYQDPAGPGITYRRGSAAWGLVTLYVVLGLLVSVAQYVQLAHHLGTLEQAYAQGHAQSALSPGADPNQIDRGGRATVPQPSPSTPAGVDPSAPQVSSAAAWQQLLAHIPATLRPSCSTWTGATVGSNDGVATAISCNLRTAPGIPDSVYYYQYNDQGSLDNAILQMTLIQKNRMAQGAPNCAKNIPAAGSYQYSQTTAPDPTDGLVACGRTDDGKRTFMDVTDNKTLTLMDMPSTTMSISDLYGYWLTTTFLQ